jgi:Domain of unknown function (DUF4331)
MKKKILLGLALSAVIVGGIVVAADHIDAPSVTGPSSTSLATDITDVYAFQSPADNTKMVLVMNVKGLMSPATTGAATFGNNVLYEMNIDNTGDNVEDLVIQFLVQNGKVRAYGPVAPGTTGTTSTVKTNGVMTAVDVTPYTATSPNVGTGSNGVKIFAGPRDDPFFFDLVRYKEVIAGTQMGFRSPGVDTFAGTNVLSLVAEIPKALLGTSATINYWCETKTK